MEVRALRWSDFPAWAELQALRYAELQTNPDLGLYTRFPEPTLVDQANYFAGLQVGLLEGRMVCVVADEDGKLVGHASVFPKGDHAEIRHIGSLGMVVRPEFRRRGVGRRLLSKALEESRGTFEIIELSVTSTNEGAIRLYRAMGFEERGRLPRSFKRGERYLDEILMSRTVEGSELRSPPRSE